MPDLFIDQKETADRDRRFNQPQAAASAETVAIPSPINTAEPMFTEEEQPVVPTSIPEMTRAAKIHAKIKNMHVPNIHVPHNMNLFSAFCENPSYVSFQTQEPDEIVLLFLRKSQFMNIPWLLATIAFTFIPPVLFLFRSQFFSIIPPLSFMLIIIPFYYLVVAMYAFVNFITWYYNAALITNKRVIDIDFHQLVFKDVAETKLALVQDVSYQQVGVFQNVFGFGHVLIQTAGAIDNFEFFAMPRPARIVEVVESLIGGKRFYEP